MTTVDIVIIGGGPGGYVAAIRAAQLGFSVVCVERRKTLGGTCLNEGCIPSKALLHSSHLYRQAFHDLEIHGISTQGVALDLPKMMTRKTGIVGELTQGIVHLFRKHKITHLQGEGSLTETPGTVSVSQEDGITETVTASRAIILATGSEPIPFPGVPFDETRILSSRGALTQETVPQTLIVLGGGYIGLEMGSVWQRLGSQVTVLERMDSLVPGMDPDISTGLQKALTKQGLTFKLSQTVTGITPDTKGVTVSLTDGSGAETTLRADALLVALGRKPFTQGLALEARGIEVDGTGRIPVSSSFETSVPGVYAIGDLISGPMLAHKASEEGVALVEILAGHAGHVDRNVIPAVVYTDPQAACVGQRAQDLDAQGIPYRIGKFPFIANARAKAVGETDGFVKILAHAETDRILGVHIFGPDAETLIGEAALAMAFSASAEDLARTCQAHPTYSESLKEAALAVAGIPLHL
jgi:dihydrolipoamide dehydrogenase